MSENDDNFDPTDMVQGVASFATPLEMVPPELRLHAAKAILEEAFLSVKFERREIKFDCKDETCDCHSEAEAVFCTVDAPVNIFFAIMLAGAAFAADAGYVSGEGDFREVVMQESDRPEVAERAMMASGALLHGLMMKIAHERGEFFENEGKGILEQFKAMLDEIPTAEKDEN